MKKKNNYWVFTKDLKIFQFTLMCLKTQNRFPSDSLGVIQGVTPLLSDDFKASVWCEKTNYTPVRAETSIQINHDQSIIGMLVY